jgi:phosphoribosylformylglycinamidine synthase
MGSRGGAGIEIDVALVPQRETGMTPYEIMLSESQERMLLVAKRGREAEVERIFEKWDLHAVKIGEVTDNGFLRVRERGTLVAEIPNRALTDDAPLYRRPVSEPEYLRELQQLDLNAITCPADNNAALLALLQSPTVASKRWVYRQYDHMVRTNTINMPGLGAGVVRIKGTDRALALSVDGKRPIRLPRSVSRRDAGGRGGVPKCRVCRGQAARCDQLPQLREPGASGNHVAVREGGRRHWRRVPCARVPITGGNVSLYNETDGTAIIQRRSSASSGCSSTPIAS